jgi:hypothetical protein
MRQRRVKKMSKFLTGECVLCAEHRERNDKVRLACGGGPVCQQAVPGEVEDYFSCFWKHQECDLTFASD